MFDSLRARLFGSHLLVGGLVLALSAVSLFVLLGRNPAVDRFVYQRLEAIVRLVSDSERRLLAGSPERRSLERALGVVGRPLGARALLFGPGMELRFDSQPELDLPSFEELPVGGGPAQPARGRFQDAQGRTWLVVTSPVGEAGLLAVAAPRPGVRAYAGMLVDVVPPLLQAALIALLASLLLAFLMARWVSGPLQGLAQAARAVAGGDFQAAPEQGGPREVRQVVNAFNEMVAQVQAGQRAQRDFVANVSHELKTPLTSIQGYAQAILDGTASDPDQRQRAADVIHAEALRLRGLVDDLLDLARIDAGQIQLTKEPFDPQALLMGVVERLQLTLREKDIELQLELDDLPRIVGDADRLRQVFLNLLVNAIDHTAEGGRITLGGLVAGSALRIFVEDSGPGIPSEEQARVFERFYQLDAARTSGTGRGAGLGLSIAQELVAAHEGTIEVDSRVGEGARFTVVLPLSRPDDSTLAKKRR